MNNLFGEEFEIKLKEPKIKDIVKKANSKELCDTDVKKILKSKKISLEEKLAQIKLNVLKILGKRKNNVLVIKDIQTLNAYINSAMGAGRIAIDTETNNSLDPITCKLMGLCLYAPGNKQAYIPVNHVDIYSNERLSWQLTENDCREALQKIIDANVFTIFHNYKFDYQVLKCTCNVTVPCSWDTLIAAKLIDENEHSAGLKQQYISKIDPSQEKYSIDHLFENVLYEQVDPEVFALYGSQDAYMTDELYLWQKPIMENYELENQLANPYKLFREVELPCIRVIAEMELTGVSFDVEYANRLRAKYENKLEAVDKNIAEELLLYKDKVASWRLTKEALQKPKKKTGEGEGKSKSEQLDDPIKLSSPTQLAILLYDILKVPVVDKESPRGTGEDILLALQDKYQLCKYLLERRSLEKMLNAFINSLPEEVNKKTGKIHCHFNQYGAATGRTSCSKPNVQQIPSHEKSIRLLFTADTDNHVVECNNNCYEIPAADEVETKLGWKKAKELVVGDTVVGNESEDIIKEITKTETSYLLYV